MNSRALVDPELAPMLDLFPAMTITAENLAEVRARVLPTPPVEECGVTLRETEVPGPAGAPPVPVRIYHPPAGEARPGCLLHIHGGGYVAGAARNLEFAHRPLAARLGCVIVSVDYRLAPETPFPGAIEDCYAALAWTCAEAAALGIDVTRIGVIGESAGGGLAAALALLARDRGEYRLAFQHLIYPMLDDRSCVRDPHPFAGEFLWHRANNHFGWSSLLGHEPGRDDVSCYAAAARAGDLAGLPPAYISTGALDLFLDENVDYAARLLRAGVPAELHVWPGAFHAFDLVPDARVAVAARRASLEALSRALEPA
jgi:triacylglycerol lipase